MCAYSMHTHTKNIVSVSVTLPPGVFGTQLVRVIIIIVSVILVCVCMLSTHVCL